MQTPAYLEKLHIKVIKLHILSNKMKNNWTENQAGFALGFSSYRYL